MVSGGNREKREMAGKSRGPSTAVGIVGLVNREGVAGLQRALGCTRRQAENITVLSRRALARGDEIDEGDIPRGTARAAQARQASLPPPEPAPVDPVAEAEGRARAIRALPPSERTRALVELKTRAATMKRSLAAGYTEWADELALIQRTQALVQPGFFA
jgi:hypothetical protein